MTWRDDQVAATRQTIVDTFIELSNAPDATPVTMAEVARCSGISPATIYRHFPNRAALVHAAAVEHMYSGVEPDLETWGLAQVRDHLLALWSTFDERPTVIREGAVSEAGREMRRSRFAAHRHHLRIAMTSSGLDPDTVEGRSLEASVSLLDSVHAYLDLRDRQGLDVNEAVDVVVWAIERLLRSAGVDPEVVFAVEPNIAAAQPA